jgi:hypothetical protein
LDRKNLVTFGFFEFKTYHNLAPKEWWTGWLGNENATAIMPMLHTTPAMMTLASTVTDFLLIIAMGLIIGRNARVLRYYYQQKNRTAS